MFNVGDKVKVTDQNPPAVGIVEKVSTWAEVTSFPSESSSCYYIRCDCWRGEARWIGDVFVKAIEA